MSFSEKILSKSGSYTYYKDKYEEHLEKIESQKTDLQDKRSTIKNQRKEIRSLEKDIKAKDNIISQLESDNEDYKELCNYIFNEYQKINDSPDITPKDIRDIRIAYVLNSFPEHSQTFVLSELKWLVENDFDVRVFYKKEPYKRIDLDFEIESIQFTSQMKLSKLLMEHDIQLMHTHFVYPIGSKFTYPVGKWLNIPFTVFAHAFDIFTREYMEKNRIAEMSKSDLCLAVYTLSDFHKNYLIDQGVDEDKIVITKQATDYEICEFDKKEGKIKNIVSVSRFVEKKGFDVLIDAAKLLEDEDLTFEIYGFGDLEDEIKGRIEEVDAKNISVKGELSPSEVRGKLMESDLIAVPCKVADNGDMDGIPTVIFESMAVGLPVLTTSVSAIPEIISDGENGFIIEPENPELMADKIREIADLSADELYEIRCRAQSDVENISSVEKTMQTYVDVLEKSFND